MVDDEADETGPGPPVGEGFVRPLANYRRSERTREVAADIRRRSAEIRTEAERVRGLSMITLLNADMTFRAARKAHRGVLDGPADYWRDRDTLPPGPHGSRGLPDDPLD